MSKYLNKEGLQRLWEHITSELGGKVDKVSGKGLSTNDYTNEDKTKLTGIDEGANKTVVDTELLSGSSNPVQNKVVTARINTIQTAITSINNNKATDFTDNDDIHYPTVKAVSDKVAKDITDSTADWNENDEDATDYIKNRTHYSSNTGSNILEVQSLSLPAALYSIETSGFEYYQYATTTTEVPYTLSVLQSASYFTLKYNISSGSTMKDTAYLIECRVTDSTGSTASAVGLIFAQAGLSICFNTSGNTVHFMSDTSQTFNHFQLIAQNTKVLKKIDNGYINNLSLEIPKLQTARYLDGLNFDGSSDIYHTMISQSAVSESNKRVSDTVPLPKVARGILILYLTKGNSVTDGIYVRYGLSDTSPIQIYYNNSPLIGDIAKFEAHTAIPLVYYNNHWNVVGILPNIQSTSEITIDDGSID